MANKKKRTDKGEIIHPVEQEWHYKLMTRYGFIAQTKEAAGFVRKYHYTHPTGHEVTYSIGVSCDHWASTNPAKSGYWRDLEPFLKELYGKDSNQV